MWNAILTAGEACRESGFCTFPFLFDNMYALIKRMSRYAFFTMARWASKANENENALQESMQSDELYVVEKEYGGVDRRRFP